MYLKQRIAAGHCLVGAGIYSYSPEAVEYSAAGMDWIWWENQHSLGDWQTTVHGVRAAHIIQVPVLIRTWTHQGETIERLLDAGAEGIIAPTVNRPEQAAEIVSHCFYPPLGKRSWGAARIERMGLDTGEWNRRIVVIMMIETLEGLQNAEAIAAVSGVDGLLIGPADLAVSLGKPGAPFVTHDAIRAEADLVLSACRNTGKAAGVIAVTAPDLQARVQEGFRFLSIGMDVFHAAVAFRQLRDASRQIAAELGLPPGEDNGSALRSQGGSLPPQA
jgi:2-keto-3-deoxy-L-rhamnonate aldolase RhmA